MSLIKKGPKLDIKSIFTHVSDSAKLVGKSHSRNYIDLWLWHFDESGLRFGKHPEHKQRNIYPQEKHCLYI